MTPRDIMLHCHAVQWGEEKNMQSLIFSIFMAANNTGIDIKTAMTTSKTYRPAKKTVPDDVYAAGLINKTLKERAKAGE